MINLEQLDGHWPTVTGFLSVEAIYAFVDSLHSDPRFTITVAGESESGWPIHHIRFGHGRVQALFLGFPHPNEPIGGVTAVSLLSLLRDNTPALIDQDVTWHVIPCADPDGARLNEGWSQQPFDFGRFMRHYYRQYSAHQVEWSFPIDYKDLHFDAPSTGTRALMQVMDRVKPDFYYALHNAMIGGVYSFISRDIGEPYYQAVNALCEAQGVPVSAAINEAAHAKPVGRAFYGEFSCQHRYEYWVRHGQNPLEKIRGGGGSVDYLMALKPKALMYISELPYMTHPQAGDDTPVTVNKRQLSLQVEATIKYLQSVLLALWPEVEPHVNRNSPFYTQVASQIPELLSQLEVVNPSLLKDPDNNRNATVGEAFELQMGVYYRCCWYHQFVRLLDDSPPREALTRSKTVMARLFDELFSQLQQPIDFSAFQRPDVGTLTKLQLSCGLIVLNALLK